MFYVLSLIKSRMNIVLSLDLNDVLTLKSVEGFTGFTLSYLEEMLN